MLQFRLKTAPAEEPVSLAEMRAMLGIQDVTDTHRDPVITARLIAARRWCEEHTRRAFVTQTWYGYASSWRDQEVIARCNIVSCCKPIIDLKADLQSVNEITYVDTNGATQTLASDQYLVDAVMSRVHEAYGASWPGVRGQANAIRIEFVCGYGAAAAVPQPIKEAIMFIVAHWENYQSSIEGAVRITTVPYAVTQLLQPYVDLRSSF